MNAFSYLIQVNLYLLLFYAFYIAVLRNETFFKLNRIYLVGSALLSLCIPLIKTDWIKGLFITEKVQALTQTVTYNIISPKIEMLNTNLEMTQSQPWLTTAGWLWLIYGLVTMVFLLNLLWKLYKVSMLFKNNIRGHAFSFFSKIAVDDQLDGKETIINHEMVHARQWHSVDVIFFEILLAMNWFNPIAYLYRNAIKNIHEFIADDSAASTLEDRSAYALLLVSNVFNTQPQQLINSFFNQSLLKKRIIMLHKTKSRKVAILKYGLSAPLFAGMLIFSSATETEAQINQVFSRVLPNTDGLMKIQLKTDSEVLPLPIRSSDHSENISKTTPVSTVKSTKTDQAKSNGLDSNPEKTKTLNEFTSPAEKLQEYIHAFFKDREEETKSGRAWFSFDVNEKKHTSNFKIISSAGFSWEKELLQHLGTFKDTVSLKAGTYSFFHGYEFTDEESTWDVKDKPKLAFGNSNTTLFHHIISDETKKEAGKIVEYIRVDYLTNSIILVDGKEATYTLTEKGFKLAETIYPKDAAIKVYKGDKAVAEHSEAARSGLIVITTTERKRSR